jgi:hypothetical protein
LIITITAKNNYYRNEARAVSVFVHGKKTNSQKSFPKLSFYLNIRVGVLWISVK